MAQKDPSPSPPNTDIAALVAQAMAAVSMSGSSSQSPYEQLQSALQQSTGYAPVTRAQLTSQPLVGIFPKWINANPQLYNLVQQHQIDPYLPDPAHPETFRVYVGPGKKIKGLLPGQVRQEIGPDGLPVHVSPGPTRQEGDRTQSAGVVANEPYSWTADQVAENIKKFREAGQTQVKDFDSLTQAWQGLVARAAQTYSFSSGKIKMTPWDALELDRQAQINAGTLTPGGSQVTHQTSRSVSDVRQADAWSALRQTASSLLGRDPTDQEVRDFAYRMNALAAKSPTITSSTTTTDTSGNSSSSSHTKQGFDSADLERGAYDTAQSDPDYAEYQSATTYFNAALSALGAIGGN